jgi:hypothetical protein
MAQSSASRAVGRENSQRKYRTDRSAGVALDGFLVSNVRFLRMASEFFPPGSPLPQQIVSSSLQVRARGMRGANASLPASAENPRFYGRAVVV